MNKKYIVNTADISQLFISAHSLKRFCVEWEWFIFQFVSENEKPKAKIILRKLKIIKVKMLLMCMFSFILKKHRTIPTKTPHALQNLDTIKVFCGFYFTCQAESAYS